MTQENPAVKLLLVDDLRDNLVALQALVRGEGRQVFCVQSGEEALSLMLEHEFALAIVDVQMPVMTGFELAELMRSTERTRRIPIVFVSAAGRELNYAFRGYETGAVDFLHKPLEPQTVRSKVNVFVDLFRQRQALERTQAELQRAVRMRDDFMSLVSHELRNPLNTLFLQVQVRKRLMAAEKPPEPATLLQMAERDERQVRSMIRLLDDMLDVTRLRTGRLAMEPAAMDLAQMLHHLVVAMGEQAKAANTPLQLQAPPSLVITADEFRVEQVVTNLLTNALRYGGGKPVHIALKTEGAEAVVCVKDHGPGIAPRDQERIFGQFERAEATSGVPGLGLGLFISRQIAQAHGGSLSVHSAPGAGAEFQLRLPL